jgi:hypothetical protein
MLAASQIFERKQLRRPDLIWEQEQHLAALGRIPVLCIGLQGLLSCLLGIDCTKLPIATAGKMKCQIRQPLGIRLGMLAVQLLLQ